MSPEDKKIDDIIKSNVRDAREAALDALRPIIVEVTSAAVHAAVERPTNETEQKHIYR